MVQNEIYIEMCEGIGYDLQNTKLSYKKMIHVSRHLHLH